MFHPTTLVATCAAAGLACAWTGVSPLRGAERHAQPVAFSRVAIGANLVYSPVHRKVLLVNGSEDFKTDIETRVWSWDGRQWAPLEGTGPRVRNGGTPSPSRIRAASAKNVST